MVGAIIGGAASLAQVGMGIADRIKGKKEYEKAQDFYSKNKFDVPESAKAALMNAERQASGVTLPGEDILRSRLADTTAQGVGAAQNVATSGGDVLGMLKDLYMGQQRGEQDISLRGAERYDIMQDKLRSELGTMSQWENQKWMYNVLYPYQQMLGRASSFSERGAQGIGMGVQGLGQTGANIMQVQGAENSFDEFMRKMGLNTTPEMTSGEQARFGRAKEMLGQTRKRLSSLDNVKIPQLTVR